MNIKLVASLFALTVGLATAAGCSADATTSDENENGEAEAEKAATSESELQSYAQRLAGAYHGDYHAGTQRPAFDGLVLKKDGTFFADVGTGIVCIMAPCPSQARITGRFIATRTYLFLYSVSGDASHGVGGMAGTYRYVHYQGHKLSLSRPWRNGWQQSLAPETSYCSAPVDCQGQNLVAPRCLGQWTCGATADRANQCAYKCGPIGGQIWPANASKLVAHNSGGGFTPPAPPGSSCTIGAAKYTFDVATKKLDWEECSFVDWSTPLTRKTGSKVLTAAEVASVNDAMNDVAISTQNICGADKPMMTLEVTSPAGVKKYTDSFYSCTGTGPFVDDIDAVFGALRDVAH